jgi:RNA polymerase sigma-70 factor, ECF subfamily
VLLLHDVFDRRDLRIPVVPGALYLDAQDRLVAVLALDIAGGQITSIGAIANPDKLTHLGPVGDLRSLLRSAK